MGRLTEATIPVGPRNTVKDAIELPRDCLPTFFDLTMKLGPVSDWALDLSNNVIAVDLEKFATSREGFFAIGDINTYSGKLKLILSGFHEAAPMTHAAKAIIHPEEWDGKPGKAALLSENPGLGS